MLTKRQYIPRFYGLRIYLVAVMLYLLLVFPISMIMLFKYGPYWMEERGISYSDLVQETQTGNGLPGDTLVKAAAIEDRSDNAADQQQLREMQIDGAEDDIHFGRSFGILFRLLAVSFLLGLIWHIPFKLLFYRKRRGKPPGHELLAFCRRWLLHSPLVNSMILGLGFGGSLIFMGNNLFALNAESGISHQFYKQFFFISLIASVLSVLFVYFWQKHRVSFRYLDYVFDSLSLYKAGGKKHTGQIQYRLWISSAMTTLLPLSIVVFYLFLSVSAVKDAFDGPLTDEQIAVVFGKYLGFIEMSNMHDSSQKLFYVNAIDSLLLFVGIFTGIIISVIYLFFFVSWTTQRISIPLNEVLHKMKESGEGKLSKLAIVRTTDEFGRLAAGFNEMAVRISKSMDDMKEITKANARFVPNEFLQFMDKKSITAIHLGDQVQKFMTVLFVDIRAFTSISESMSPRENFNFLNHYLSTMEPVIRQHHGFIDKFIGDSIMALFPGKPEDAVDAALTMRSRLIGFNRLMQQTGHPAIDTGAGIHAGNLMLGVVGGEGRMETTVISDAVNLASRLEGLTRDYQASIIISASTLELIADKEKYTCRYLDQVKVKGRQEAVDIYELTAKHG